VRVIQKKRPRSSARRVPGGGFVSAGKAAALLSRGKAGGTGNCLLWLSLRLTGGRKVALGLMCKLAALPSDTSVAQRHLFTSPSSPATQRHTQMQSLRLLHPLSLSHIMHQAVVMSEFHHLSWDWGRERGRCRELGNSLVKNRVALFSKILGIGWSVHKSTSH